MAKKCYRVEWINCIGQSRAEYLLAESIVYNSSGGGCGNGWLQSADMGWTDPSQGSIQRLIKLEQVDCSFCGNPQGCEGLIPKYDCINGSCYKSTVYNTPGKYSTLEECQANCRSTANSCNPPFQCIDPTNFCPPGKVCVPQDEWNQILGLIARNKAKHCR